MNEPKNKECVQQDVRYIPVQMVAGSITDDDIDLYELGSTLWDGRWLVVSVFFTCMMLACIVVYFVITPKFKAVVVIRATEYSQPIIEDYLGSGNFRKQLIEQLDLLPYIFEKSWDSLNKTWKKDSRKNIPTIQQGMQSDNFPLSFSVNKQNKLISVFWEGKDPELTSKNLKLSLDMMSRHVLKEHVTNYQITINILQEEFQMLIPAFNYAEAQFVDWNASSVAAAGILSEYALLKSKIADQRARDTLSRMFTIISPPEPPSEPFKPNRAMILGATAFGSLFMGILAVFVRSAVRRARLRRQAAA